jgi:hypothetical protein
MALPVALGLFGMGASVLEGIFNNKRVKKQAAASKMAASIGASERKDEQAKVGAANADALKVNAADRRTFGRSAKAVALNQLIKAATNESAIESDRSMRILQISAEASRNKTSLIGAGIGGFSTGLSLGTDLKTLMG